MRDIEAQQRTTAVVLAIFDAVLLLVAGVAASWIRFPVRFGHELSLLLQHPGFIVYAIAVLWCLGSTFDLFRPENWRSREQLAVRLAALAVALPIGLALGTYVVLPWRFGRGLLALTVLLTVPLMWMVRTFWIATFRWRPRSAVVVGDGPIVKALTEELERRSSPPFVIGQHLRMPEVHQLEGKARDTLAANDLVIVANLSAPEAFERLAELNFLGTSVIDAAGAYAALTGRIPVLQVDAGWFIATGDFSSIATSPFHRVQRILDVVAAVILLMLSGPVLLAAMLALWLAYGRPVFYRQERLGQFKRRFQLLKLRTMLVDAEPNGPEFASPGDDRVHLLGRAFRRWRVDELPQLINVLRGEMSLVGPRPERPKVAADLERKIPFFAFRYSVKPGITGWAQVNLPYCSETNEHQAKLEFDLYSLRHHGPGMYMLVLLRTLGALVLRPGR